MSLSECNIITAKQTTVGTCSHPSVFLGFFLTETVHGFLSKIGRLGLSDDPDLGFLPVNDDLFKR